MELPNEIVLRPRFSLKLEVLPKNVLSAFEAVAKTQSDFVISRVDDYVFIRIPKNKQHFWSPQLHLEIYKLEEQPTILRGLFGPNPTVWTLFMFLHFIIATLFVGVGIWMYTNISLKASFIFPIVSMIVLFIFWFLLYFLGRLGKEAGKKEMKMLHAFMYDTLNKIIA